MSKSGLLLITGFLLNTCVSKINFHVKGPLKLNATPMRRVAQAFVIATNTKLDINALELPERINDDYFKKDKKAADKSKAGIFATGEQAVY
jgi:large subunit ribosomal protein L6e